MSITFERLQLFIDEVWFDSHLKTKPQALRALVQLVKGERQPTTQASTRKDLDAIFSKYWEEVGGKGI